MTGIDTNVLVRFFAKDDPAQSPKAKTFLGSLTEDNPGWVGMASLLELVWVMGKPMHTGRDGIVHILEILLHSATIEVEQASTVADAVKEYRKGRADFADCLIAASARAAGCGRTVTFDHVAARDAGMELLA